MSSVSTFPFPSLRPSSAAAMTPATGPDSSSAIGARAALAKELTPPLERIARIAVVTP
jgi:hypothetical protein